MKRGLVVSIITAGAALGSGVASANSSYWRQNGLLLEVSADPRDGSDFVQTDPTRADRLELVALDDAVRLRGLTIQFSDGRSYSQPMSTIVPGQRVMIDLPENCGAIQHVQLDYGRQIVDRTPARLQIIPHENRYASPVYRRDQHRYDYEQPAYLQAPAYDRPRYQRPAYRTQPSYSVRPQSSWSGSIQGRFRF